MHDRVIKGPRACPRAQGQRSHSSKWRYGRRHGRSRSRIACSFRRESDEDSDSDEEDVGSTAAVVSVDRIAVSTDGQWLATSDNRARTHIFNLDLISVRAFAPLHLTHTNLTHSTHCVLPTFPRAAQTLVFDPNAPFCAPPRLPRQHDPDI